jgi:hypothetical protein
MLVNARKHLGPSRLLAIDGGSFAQTSVSRTISNARNHPEGSHASAGSHMYIIAPTPRDGTTDVELPSIDSEIVLQLLKLMLSPSSSSSAIELDRYSAPQPHPQLQSPLQSSATDHSASSEPDSQSDASSTSASQLSRLHPENNRQNNPR